MEVYTHPASFTWKIDSITGELIGIKCFAENLSERCDLRLSKNSVEISKNVIFLGEIPSLVDFEERSIVNKMIPKEYIDWTQD